MLEGPCVINDLIKNAMKYEFCLQLRTFCDDYDQKAGHFFFERDPTAFVAVLNYHITGHLHIPRSKCVKSFEDEVTYWGIPFDIEPCCDAYYCDQWEHTEAIKKADQLESTLKKQERKSIDAKKWETYLKKLWNLFEHPATSVAAKVSLLTIKTGDLYQLCKGQTKGLSF